MVIQRLSQTLMVVGFPLSSGTGSSASIALAAATAPVVDAAIALLRLHHRHRVSSAHRAARSIGQAAGRTFAIFRRICPPGRCALLGHPPRYEFRIPFSHPGVFKVLDVQFGQSLCRGVAFVDVPLGVCLCFPSEPRFPELQRRHAHPHRQPPLCDIPSRIPRFDPHVPLGEFLPCILLKSGLFPISTATSKPRTARAARYLQFPAPCAIPHTSSCPSSLARHPACRWHAAGLLHAHQHMGACPQQP